MVAPEQLNHPEVRRRLEKLHHDTLRAAREEKLIRFYVDFKHLNKIGSPVYDPWENVLPLLALIFCGLAVLLFQGVIMGTMALLIAMALYVVMVRPYMAGRLRKRTEDFMLSSPAAWDRVWKVGGVAVVLNHMSSIGCVAPAGNWKVFARDNLQDAVEARRHERAEAAAKSGKTSDDGKHKKVAVVEADILPPEHDDEAATDDGGSRRRRRRRRRDEP